MNDKTGRELEKADNGSGKSVPAEKTINLGHGSELLDLSGLSESQVEALKTQYAKGMIDIHKKAAELKVDVGALDATLVSMTDQTSKATQSGTHVTMTHTQSTSIGRTEVVMGNTERAAAGKVSRSAAGDQDRTLWIVGIVAVAVILVAVFAVGGR